MIPMLLICATIIVVACLIGAVLTMVLAQDASEPELIAFIFIVGAAFIALGAGILIASGAIR